MGVARVYSAQPVYLDTSIIQVEADLSRGLHSFSIVGLPDKAVEESRERVSAALKNAGFSSPKHSSKRILISLAPANIRKEGARFDLPIAMSYLLASKEVKMETDTVVFLGELSLKGELRGVSGVLSIAKKVYESGHNTLVVPKENAVEAALVAGLTVLPAETLQEVVEHFKTESSFEIEPQPITTIEHSYEEELIDMGDIRGQETAKRGLEIAAAGRHNVVLYGPPGTGKTMLARALQSILPPLSLSEVLEATAIHSIAGTLKAPMLTSPPFRSPHHTSSHIAVVGGGTIPRPGEVTLAHRGVLFLDEFPEFERRVVDALREPLEDKIVSVSRAKGTAQFPANFILIAALNPSRERGEVVISDLDRERLKKKISGPVVDRIDMWIEVSHIDHEKLLAREERVLESPDIREQVVCAREMQQKRFQDGTKTNSDMNVTDIDGLARMTKEAQVLLTSAAKNLSLSPRSYHRTIKLARTIADLDNSEEIEGGHILESLTYRPKDLFE